VRILCLHACQRACYAIPALEQGGTSLFPADRVRRVSIGAKLDQPQNCLPHYRRRCIRTGSNAGSSKPWFLLRLSLLRAPFDSEPSAAENIRSSNGSKQKSPLCRIIPPTMTYSKPASGRWAWSRACVYHWRASQSKRSSARQGSNFYAEPHLASYVAEVPVTLECCVFNFKWSGKDPTRPRSEELLARLEGDRFKVSHSTGSGRLAVPYPGCWPLTSERKQLEHWSAQQRETH
jgi:hypothetical protein